MRSAQELGTPFVCFAALMLFLSSSASGQSWRSLDAFGYGALGAAMSFPLINGEGSGTFVGSDEQTVTVLAVPGSGLGALHVGRRWGELTGTRFEIRPTTLDSGRLGVVARLRF